MKNSNNKKSAPRTRQQQQRQQEDTQKKARNRVKKKNREMNECKAFTRMYTRFCIAAIQSIRKWRKRRGSEAKKVKPFITFKIFYIDLCFYMIFMAGRLYVYECVHIFRRPFSAFAHFLSSSALECCVRRIFDRFFPRFGCLLSISSSIEIA